MEPINILFFVISSFFAMDGAQIGADKTTVTLYPESNKIEIVQENLFGIIQTDRDTTLVMETWDKIATWKESQIPWSEGLDSLSDKSLSLDTINDTLKSHLIFSYSEEKDLEVMGIWYVPTKNQFSINNIPQYNIKTEDGVLEGNYWVFNSDSSFSFSIEPFLVMPGNFQKMKLP